MRTIVKPKEYIDMLWGEQRIRDTDTYRMMRYVLRVDHDDKVLLHNVVTGQLVVLDGEEAAMVDRLPLPYESTMEQLVNKHFLVPEDYDEHQDVVNLRLVLQKYDTYRIPDAITYYTILPTTACNARCYYCFEQGVETVSMTEKTANEVVAFITKQCKNRKVTLHWFGGEPTIITRRIDQICAGLNANNVVFTSLMTTNGYAIDEEMVSKAKSLWNLQSVSISVDGVGRTYKETKAYVMTPENPYERVMQNINLLLRGGIGVNLRMNFDVNNYQEFNSLINDVIDRFKERQLLHLFAHPINGEYRNTHGELVHGTEEWFSLKLAQLNYQAYKRGVYKGYPVLPRLRYYGCGAAHKTSIIITPEGNLAECPEEFCGDQVIGTLSEGVTKNELVNLWRQFANYDRCVQCICKPYCDRLANCEAQGRCISYRDYIMKFQEAIKLRYDSFSQAS